MSVLTNAEKRFALENMKRDMQLFGETCMHSTFQVKTPPFHKEIYKILEDKSLGTVNIVAPRGHAKSSCVAGVFVLHEILFGGDEQNIALISKTQSHAVDLLGSIKKWVYNKEIQYFFGDWGEETSRKWDEKSVIFHNGTRVKAYGTGQQIRGGKLGDTRYTLTVLDDPEDEKNTGSLEAIERNVDWYFKTCEPALDPQRGRIAIIGTKIVNGCIVDVLSGIKAYKTLWYKAVLDFEKKIVLWPEWQSYDKLMAKKLAMTEAAREHIWYQEYQNEIVARETQPFKPEYNQFYEGKVEYDKMDKVSELVIGNRRIPINIFMGIDPATSLAQTADFSVSMVIGVDNKRNVYVLEYFRERILPLDFANKIIAQTKRYHVQGINIETVAFQDMLRDYIHRKGVFLPGIERQNKPRGKKKDRLLSLQPYFATKSVYMQKEMVALLNELFAFPDSGTHDDTLDALYYAVQNNYCPVQSEYIGTSHKKKNYIRKKRYFNWKKI